MFLAPDHSKQIEKTDYPVNTTFSENDWHILASYWHPIALSHDVKDDEPCAAKLLDVNLVLYRYGGKITVALDRCKHRGAALSKGWIRDGQLVCKMHGLRYDGEGNCIKIPCMGPNARIPDKLRLTTYPVQERYGIVWTCLKGEDQARGKLPEWPLIEDPNLVEVHIPANLWKSSAPRHVENFNDQTHFPFVHEASFGGDPDERVEPIEVIRTDYGYTFKFKYEENRKFEGNKVRYDASQKVEYTHELTLPFSTSINVEVLESGFVHYFCDTVCPISATESLIFQVMTDTSGCTDKEYWIKDSQIILDEDIPMVESQTPVFLPLDLTEELHLPPDRTSLEYRRMLAEMGLGK